MRSDPRVVSFEPNATISTPEVQTKLDGSVVSILDGSVVSILDGLGDSHLVNYFDNQVWNRYVDQPATSAIGLAAGHASAGSGTGIVAVIDTGVDPGHPALAGSLVPGYDFIHEAAGVASEWTDLDGSVVSILDGSVVSILDGQSAVTVNGSVVAILDQQTASQLDTSLLPRSFGHGTMVAGLVHLVAPGARIMPLKAFSADGTSTVFDVVRAIYYAIEHGARVINMSFSATTASPEITHAINEATSRGIICIASAGNLGEETLVYPGALRNVIGVGSTTSTSPALRSSFSNYGDALVSVGAPGEAVITTYPGGHYAASWGTSFSAPLAAGGAALLVSVDPTVDQTKAAGVARKGAADEQRRHGQRTPEPGRSRPDRGRPGSTVRQPHRAHERRRAVWQRADLRLRIRQRHDCQRQVPAGSTSIGRGGRGGAVRTGVGHHIDAERKPHADRDCPRSRRQRDHQRCERHGGQRHGSAVGDAHQPLRRESLAGTVAVTAAASDDLEVARVRFTVDGTPIGEDPAAPFEAAWTTTSVANGSHVVAAIAFDAAGHQTTASAVVTVANDNGAPTVTLTSPTGGATLSGTVPLTATVSDDVGVVSVTYLVDGAVAGVETPAGRSWNTTTVANSMW